MFARCPAGRPGTADEMANIAELLMSDAGAFITGSTFLADGGATASYYYGSLQPRGRLQQRKLRDSLRSQDLISCTACRYSIEGSSCPKGIRTPEICLM